MDRASACLAGPVPDLAAYDRVLLAFSGGKDSLGCLLHLLEAGVPASRIELHHHDVDGDQPFIDWPCTLPYCRAVAGYFGVPLYRSWRAGGFLGEMDRQGDPTGAVLFELPDGGLGRAGGAGPPGWRGRFPPGQRRPAGEMVLERAEDRGPRRRDPRPGALLRRPHPGGYRRARRGEPRTGSLSDLRGASHEVIAATGLSVREHQHLTLDRFDAIAAAGTGRTPLMPVLQGWHAADYRRHLDAYGGRLGKGAWVGVCLLYTSDAADE